MKPGPIDGFLLSLQQQILEPLVTLVALAAFIVFVWGVVDFIRGADDTEKQKTGRQHMIWGIIGLTIIFGANAIINFILATLDTTVGL